MRGLPIGSDEFISFNNYICFRVRGKLDPVFCKQTEHSPEM